MNPDSYHLISTGEFLRMFSLSEIRAFVLREIAKIEDRSALLDVYYIILKLYGKSYVQARRAWIRHNQKQLKLFNNRKTRLRGNKDDHRNKM